MNIWIFSREIREHVLTKTEREAADMANDDAWRLRGEGKRFGPSSTASLNQPIQHAPTDTGHAMPMLCQ